jgi:hypothetical protein
VNPSIAHHVDLVEIEGVVEQVYNYLIYSWTDPDVTARAYLDDIHVVSILSGEPTPPIMDYLRQRYAVIQRLERHGYVVVAAA